MTTRAAALASVFLLAWVPTGFAQQYLPDDQLGRQQMAQQYVPDQDQQTQPNQGGQGVQGQRMPRQGSAMMPFESMMRGHRMEMMGRLVAALANGTFFRLKHGDDEIIVHCPQGSSTVLQNCITAATTLIKAFPQMGEESSSSDTNQNSNQN